MIELNDKAHNHILQLMVESGITPETHNLRVGVKGGGCSGLTYTMDFDDKIDPTDDWFEFSRCGVPEELFFLEPMSTQAWSISKCLNTSLWVSSKL